MNVIFLQGGLGNQMFQYAFYLALKHKHFDVECDISMLLHQKQHNGYELSRLFGIQLNKDCYLFNIVRLYYYCRTHQNNLLCSVLLNILRRMYYALVLDTAPSSFFSDIVKTRKNLFLGYWQSEFFFKEIKNDIFHAFTFKIELLSLKTLSVLEDIKRGNSVSVHIRRGDYLLPENLQLYGNICTIEYYQKALTVICERVSQPSFFVFSNDIAWVKEHINIPNSIYVNFNSGSDSWQDMFLMSQCKHNIIANSSFSWWGAWLNRNTNKIVITPSRFINLEENSDIIPDTWIRI